MTARAGRRPVLAWAYRPDLTWDGTREGPVRFRYRASALRMLFMVT